jgi:deazaflavin-dependent oxidoreductase (nitroreductase family)
MVYLPDGGNLVVVPANAGSPVPPDWWLNLRAAGDGVAILGHERRRVTPHEAKGAERARLWRQFAARTPVEHYQALTPRRIPVVVLTPVRH